MEDKASVFLDKVFSRIKTINFDIKNWPIDHICYRTSSFENYQQMKSFFESVGKLLIESEVNQRPIASYKLYNPIKYKDYTIDVVEVPAPKKDKNTIEGFEHIEFVIDESFEQIMKKYPKLNYDLKGISKTLNPELVIKFTDCCIKLHHQSLETVIEIEKGMS